MDGRPAIELIAHLDEAAGRYHEALRLLPQDAINDLAVCHTQLGITYLEAGNLDRALHHSRQAIHRFEAQGDLYLAAESRRNAARALLSAGRRADALEYANAALRGFKSYGDRTAAEIRDIRELIEKIRG